MEKKTAIITGASSGIGKEFAKLHASRGGDLVVVARSKDKLYELKQELENKYNISVMVIIYVLIIKLHYNKINLTNEINCTKI